MRLPIIDVIPDRLRGSAAVWSGSRRGDAERWFTAVLLPAASRAGRGRYRARRTG